MSPDASVIFGDMILPILDIEAAMSSQAPLAGLFLSFSFADPVEGTMTFALGGAGFKDSGTPVSACVTSWGALRKFMTEGAQVRDSDVLVEMAADAWVTEITGTWRDRLYALIRTKRLRGVPVTVYQWVSSEGDSGSAAIWHGYWNGYEGFEDRDGAMVVTVRLTSNPPDFNLVVGDVVTKTLFTAAPQDSIGQMIPRAYGDFRTQMAFTAGSNGSHWASFFSSPVSMVRGVVKDDSVATLKTTVRFCKNDGAVGVWATPTAGTTFAPETGGSFYVYVPAANAVGLIDGASISNIVSDANKVEVDISMTPSVYVSLQPGEKGATNASGLTNLSTLFDDNHSNYVVTTGTDYTLAVNCPSINIDGAQVKAVYVALDVENANLFNSLTFDFGLWNVAHVTGTPNWFHGIKKTVTLASGSGRTGEIGDLSGAQHAVYGPQDFAFNLGSNTVAEFSSGRFIGRDAAGSEVPGQLMVTLTSANKDGLRIYGISAVIRLVLPAGSVMRSRTSMVGDPSHYIYDVQGRLIEAKKYPSVTQVAEVTGAYKGLQYLLNTGMQKDTAIGTYTGTASALIEKGGDIAAHLLGKVGGLPLNMTSGTVGNFVDARSEDTAGEKTLALTFGPEVVSMDGAVRALQARHPIRLHDEDGTWNCIYEEMNPHSSRFYRSTAEPIKISARKHIIRGSLRINELPYNEIVNTVSVNYGHGFGDNRTAGTLRYQNPLSVELLGQRNEAVIDEPWILPETIGTDPPAATYLAHHLGRVKARARLTVSLALSQAFWDLKRGHVVEFDSDMESVGLHCPAYKCGRLDYSFVAVSTAPTTNYAESSAPHFVTAGLSSDWTIWGASQQFDHLNFHGVTAGAYVTTYPWSYWDGAAWQNLSGVVASDAGDPEEVFKRTGNITISWTRPSPWLWKKSEYVLGAATPKGPCYFVGLNYGTVSTGSVGTALTDFSPTWSGRLFEAIEVTRKPGGVGDYPYVDVVLQEVM